MLGAIIGDVVGSVYERNPIKTVDFPWLSEDSHITDDSILTVATAEALLDGSSDFASSYRKYYNMYPKAGYGSAFTKWAKDPTAGPYGSWGNGSAMRVSPVAWLCFNNEDLGIKDAEELAKKTAEVSHNNEHGIAGAQAVTSAIWLSLSGEPKEVIREYITEKYGYNLNRTIEEIRPDYDFDASCQGSVPESIIAFLDSNCISEAVRLAVSLGGDADTQASIAGAISEAFYMEIPPKIAEDVYKRLDENTKIILSKFYMKIKFR